MIDIKSKKIGVLAGGPSSEREISLTSGEAVYNALKEEGCDVALIDVDENSDELKATFKNKKINFAFIALHGRFGEDGTIQRFLEKLAIPYTGSGPEASHLALDKLASKEIFEKNKIDIPSYKIIKSREKIETDDFNFPFVVKPRYEGSSIGLSVIREKKDMAGALEKARKYSDTVIVEEYIKGHEITVGILNNEPLCVIQVEPGGEFYDYEAKYSRSDTRYLVPAPIKKEDYKKSQEIGKRAHMALNCKAFSRVDMILGDNGKVYVLEVNTIPGLTSRSLLPKAAEQAGISFNQLCRRIAELALQ